MIVITHYEGDQWNMYTRMGRKWKVHFLPVACEQAPLWQPGGPETTILFEGVTRSHTKAAHQRRHECPSRLALLAINEELACSLR